VLAYIVGFVRASQAATTVWVPVIGLPLFLAVMFWGVRPLLGRLEHDSLSNDRKALLLVLLLACALATDALGLHLLFGVFMLGTMMPRNAALASHLTRQFESLTVLLLLPLFFAYTGLRTRIGEIRGADNCAICALIIAVAVLGKLGGTSIAARMGGFPWREALAIGSMMNTRGLMELVVLNIGLDAGVISPTLFSMLVVMAIVTTMMTPPLVDRFTASAPSLSGKRA
jgi:Kef-type K+ transport system membrane component KefB